MKVYNIRSCYFIDDDMHAQQVNQVKYNMIDR